MNRKILLIIALLSYISIQAMEEDDDDDDSNYIARYQDLHSQDPGSIYDRDNLEPITETSARYQFPVNFEFLNASDRRDFRAKLETLNQYLWLFRMKMTLQNNQHETKVTFNEVIMNPEIDENRQARFIPFYQISIPLGHNHLNGDWNKLLINKRLEGIKALAYDFAHNNPIRQRTRMQYRDSISFMDRMKFILKYRALPEVETDLAYNISDTLILPFTNMIKRKVSNYCNANIKREIKELKKKLESEEPVLEKVVDLNAAQEQLAQLKEANKSSWFPSQSTKKQIQDAEERFIRQFETTAKFLAEQEAL